MFCVEWFYNGGMLFGMLTGCPPLNLHYTTRTFDNQYTLTDNCNRGCECTTSVFTPICSMVDKSTTYFSPCFGGCHRLDRITGTVSGCSCIHGGQAKTGYCQSDIDNCNKLTQYLLVMTMAGIISSTARTGNTLITLRAIDPKDKSFAMGVIGTFLALFSFIPYPLIFGAVVDSTCLVWEEKCGKTGKPITKYAVIPSPLTKLQIHRSTTAAHTVECFPVPQSISHTNRRVLSIAQHNAELTLSFNSSISSTHGPGIYFIPSRKYFDARDSSRHTLDYTYQSEVYGEKQGTGEYLQPFRPPRAHTTRIPVLIIIGIIRLLPVFPHFSSHTKHVESTTAPNINGYGM
ncbi:unnamed protein product, partial [Oppiella nova]